MPKTDYRQHGVNAIEDNVTSMVFAGVNKDQLDQFVKGAFQAAVQHMRKHHGNEAVAMYLYGAADAIATLDESPLVKKVMNEIFKGKDETRS